MAKGSLPRQTETSLRTFVAIELPENVRAWIAGQQAQVAAALSVAGAHSTIRMTPAGDLHLTLRFLGDTDDVQCRQLAKELDAAAMGWQPLELVLGPLGCFPNCRQPNVVWLGVEGDVAELAAIQAVVERTVQQVGFAAETRPFAPHLTIGRAAKSTSRPALQQAGQVVTQLASAPLAAPPHFGVDHLVHMQSDLRQAGPIYTPVVTITFGRRA